MKITKKDLEEIRAKAIDYWSNSEHKLKKSFIEQLRNGGILIGNKAFEKDLFEDPDVDPTNQDGRLQNGIRVIDGEGINIGAWQLEPEGKNFILIRHGAHNLNSLVIFNFYLSLVKDKKGWKIKGDSYVKYKVRKVN